MPYNNNSDLPDAVRKHLPLHAQDIYREAFNHAYKQYDQPSKRKTNSTKEETAHKVAWAAVKKSYSKGKDGEWHKKKGS